ncbi:Uncharacterised protein [uncultured archaeon]|nr:Uncharacterised protein [uncultured archaeon]
MLWEEYKKKSDLYKAKTFGTTHPGNLISRYALK